MNADRCTILVVDDDPVNIGLINASLKEDYRIRAATSGEAALKAILVQPLPDLAILDIMMPEMDGYELCLRLNSDALTREIPVIFLTAMSQVEDEARGFRVGAVDYIHKPISPPVLQARVRTHLALKNARDMLQKQNEVLEDLVKQRTVQLAEALDQALAAGRAKTAFLQTMSHELRTPLNHILGYSEMLAEELEDRPELLPDLGRIRTSGKRLLEMIACVLEYARNEGADIIAREPVAVAEVIRRSVAECEDSIRKSNNRIEVSAAPDIMLQSDPSRIQSVVTEFLRNAAKFTQGGSITATARRDSVRVLVEVSDTGIGMTPEQIERCFDAFWQADTSTSRSYEGTGMGLASAKQIAQQLGGEITVQSQPGKGSTFTLHLPA